MSRDITSVGLREAYLNPHFRQGAQALALSLTRRAIGHDPGAEGPSGIKCTGLKRDVGE
jgi:hypothetical protein